MTGPWDLIIRLKNDLLRALSYPPGPPAHSPRTSSRLMCLYKAGSPHLGISLGVSAQRGPAGWEESTRHPPQSVKELIPEVQEIHCAASTPERWRLPVRELLLTKEAVPEGIRPGTWLEKNTVNPHCHRIRLWKATWSISKEYGNPPYLSWTQFPVTSQGSLSQSNWHSVWARFIGWADPGSGPRGAE